MDLPPASPKIQRLARQLTNIPLELVEHIIADLPLHKVLELLSASSDDLESADHDSEERLSPLVHAVLISPTWKLAFPSIEDTKLLLRSWKGLNQLSWFYSRQHFAQSRLVKHVPIVRIRAGRTYPGQRTHISFHMKNGLPRCIRMVLQGDDWEQVRRLPEGYFRALSQYLPREADVLFGVAPNTPLPARLLGNNARRKLNDEALSDFVTEFRDSLENWDSESLLRLLPHLFHAWFNLTRAWASEIESLASLYERFPTLLKPAKAPQTYRVPLNIEHVTSKLRLLAKRLRSWRAERPGFEFRPDCQQQKTPYAFRYRHNVLVPYNWCLQPFTIVLEEKKPDIPAELVADLHNAVKGLTHVYEFDETSKQYPRIKGSTEEPRKMEFVVHYEEESAMPSPDSEIEWLTSFAAVVAWMKDQYPDLVTDLRGPGMRIYKSGQGKGQAKLLPEEQDYRKWIETTPPNDIADYLRRDSHLCNNSGVPSFLAFFMPPFSSPKARLVAKHLSPKEGLSLELQKLLYDNILDKIKQYTPQKAAAGELSDDAALAYEMPSEGKVNFGHDDNPCTETPDQSTSWEATVKKYVATSSDSQKSRSLRCYICQRHITRSETAHKLLHYMCKPCGEFNMAGSALSSPRKLYLGDKIALVTGARVNLGFHTALRLLRCGAKAIVTSRYPYDALFRYRREKDSADWLNELRVLGADFRSARDAFELVEQVKTIVGEWRPGIKGLEKPRLDILINNAAQTLTDSDKHEAEAIERENSLRETLRWLPQTRALSTEISYQPRVKGGMPSYLFLEDAGNQFALLAGNSATASSSVTVPEATAQKSSWVQNISEIPYQDMVAAQSVNALVPLILIRELLPLMSHHGSEKQGHIINVSSREGIFENKRDHSAKRGHHVHTNMSKAALNMITETEAAPAWQEHQVAMNTVDPGYMSAAPEMKNANGGARPLSWEDGAGRVLWPIAMAEGR